MLPDFDFEPLKIDYDLPAGLIENAETLLEQLKTALLGFVSVP